MVFVWCLCGVCVVFVRCLCGVCEVTCGVVTYAGCRWALSRQTAGSCVKRELRHVAMYGTISKTITVHSWLL